MQEVNITAVHRMKLKLINGKRCCHDCMVVPAIEGIVGNYKTPTLVSIAPILNLFYELLVLKIQDTWALLSGIYELVKAGTKANTPSRISQEMLV